MDLQSDYNRINYLLQTDKMEEVVFEEKEDLGEVGFQSGGYNMEELNNHEKELYSIFEKSRKYGKKLEDLNTDLIGGQDEGTTKKRKAPQTIMNFIAIAKVIKNHNQDSEIGWTDMVGVAKLIWRDATDISKSKTNDDILKIAIDMAKTPKKYVDEFKENKKNAPPKERKVKKAKLGNSLFGSSYLF